MAAPFPLAPAPAWYAEAVWNQAASKRNGVHYVGDTVTITLTKAGATRYNVVNFDGATVASGAMSGTTLNLGSSWDPGWYRVYFTGPNTDPLFGNSYGITNFCVIRSNTNFIPMPAGNVTGYEDVSSDQIAKGVLGIGAERWLIDHANAPTTGTNTLAATLQHVSTTQAYWTASGYTDPARPRYCWVSFPNGAYDYVQMPSTGGNYYLRCYCKTAAIDGTQVFVSLGPGTSSGAKVTVYYPNVSTVVETYDNQPNSNAAQTAINAASSYIFVHAVDPNAGTLAVTAIGRAYYNGVVSCVESLYAAGVTRFEGPSNEPPWDAGTVQQMLLFQAAVHAGNASAIAIGPCLVDISTESSADGSPEFFNHGGGVYCDEISFHAYNSMTNGDINLANHKIGLFKTLLASNGLAAKTLWQTEATQASTAVYGVHHPKRARLTILEQLMWEQHGVPRERNNPWYTVSQGYWAVPAWWENSDGSLQPQAVMGRVLAEETFGQTHQSILDFGGLANNIFLGSLYAGASAQTAVVLTTSALPGATVAFSTSAAGPLTVVDAFGNASSAVVTGGLFTVPVREIPTYIQLPTGATLTVETVNDWGGPPYTDVALTAACTVGGIATTIPTSGGFITNYGSQTGIYKSPNEPPEAIILKWVSPVNIDKVVIWCGSAWQNDSAFTAFTISTSIDSGVTWTLRKTVDVSASATAFVAGSDWHQVGCELETYWPEQWVFDETLPEVVTCNALQINVTATSYGGEPTSACITAGGQGNPAQHVSVQRIAVLDAALAPVVAAVGETSVFGASPFGSSYFADGYAGATGPTTDVIIVATIGGTSSLAAPVTPYQLITFALAGTSSLAAAVTTIQTDLLNAQATIQAWIAANPTGAVLTAAQTLVVIEMLNWMTELLLQESGA
jgi:hypothetical protein